MNTLVSCIQYLSLKRFNILIYLLLFSLAFFINIKAAKAANDVAKEVSFSIIASNGDETSLKTASGDNLPKTTNPAFQLSSPYIGANDKISLFFQNIEIRTLLQLLGKISNKSFVISDAIKGNTTLNLKNVTPRQALQIILESHGLASQKYGNVIFISTIDEITINETKQLQSQQSISSLMPLKSAMLPLKYADASDIGKLLKGERGQLLTSRGEVAVDIASNTIIIRDISRNLNEVVHYVRRLDKPARQVSIEARIVNLDSTYESQLGVRFGLSNSRSLSGTLAGANQLAQGVNVANVTPLDDRLNFDLPASALSSGATPASVGLALARLGPIMLDLELSALEEEGHSQIIAKPRIVTSNQQKATIQTGEEIPYQNATSSGATSIEFKKAVLSLEIQPQITPDNRIILKMKATEDTRGQQLLVAQQTTSGATITSSPVFGPPIINTQEVASQVLLRNNETVVIGGIYKLTKINTLDRVPFFSDIPYIGNLFKHRGITNSRTELLIFITPKIIDALPRQRTRHYARMRYKGEG